MDVISFIKKNKFFSIATISFLIWLIFLTVLSLIAQREVIFYDALAQRDVSAKYFSSIPITRNLIEPFYGLAYILRDDFGYIVGFLITYIVIRSLYLILKHKGRVASNKFHVIKCILKDFVRFSFQVLSLALVAVLVIVGIGYFSIGFFFVNRYWRAIILVATIIGSASVLLKAFHLLFLILRPNKKFGYSAKKRYKRLKSQPEVNRYYLLSRKEFVYYFGTMFLLLFTHISLLSIRFPTHYIETELDDNEFLFDFHVHTDYSDGWLTVEDRVLWYIDHGISGAAFSDHDNTRGGIGARSFVEQCGLDFTVMIAQEWTDHENDIHMNIFGLTEDIVPLESEVPGGPRALNASDMIKYVKHWGGYVTVNHYNNKQNENGGIGVPYTYEQLRDWGVDGFEIVNGGGVRVKEIRRFCLANNLICIGGSDIHINEDLNTFIKLKLDDPDDKSVDNIFKNLRKNTHEVVAMDIYPNRASVPDPIDDIVEDLGFGLIEDFLTYITNIDSIQVLSWMIWSCGAYLIVFVSFRKIKKMDLELLRAKIL